jgi:HEPN domain-containing protein
VGPNQKIFKKEYAIELLRIAENDILSAIALSKTKEIRKETVLFHFEQSVEKALKAVLCHLERPVPLTHDIYAIIQHFDEYDLPPGGYELHDLTPYATVRRYEEGTYLIDEKDISVASNLTYAVLTWAKDKISK